MDLRQNLLWLSVTGIILLLLCAQYGAVTIHWRDWFAPLQAEALSGSSWVLWQLRLIGRAFLFIAIARASHLPELSDGDFTATSTLPIALGPTHFWPLQPRHRSR